jgi:hypothetical protein
VFEKKSTVFYGDVFFKFSKTYLNGDLKAGWILAVRSIHVKKKIINPAHKEVKLYYSQVLLA